MILLLHLPIRGRTAAHRREYAAVMAQAEDILKDSRIRFVLLHLPVPHPPGIFNRKLCTLSDHGTYLDNLVLADQTLGDSPAQHSPVHAGGEQHNSHRLFRPLLAHLHVAAYRGLVTG